MQQTKISKQKENRLVVGSSQWAESIPEWLLEEIKNERMMLGMLNLGDSNCERVGDAEVVAYLMTLSLRQPLSRDYAEIYRHLATKVMSRRNSELPEDIRKDELSNDGKRILGDLRSEIYTKRGGKIHHPLLDAMRQIKRGRLK